MWSCPLKSDHTATELPQSRSRVVCTLFQVRGRRLCLSFPFLPDQHGRVSRCTCLTVNITRLFQRAGRRNAPTPVRTTTGTKNRQNANTHKTLAVREREARTCTLIFVYVARHRLLSTSGKCKTQMRVHDQRNVWVDISFYTTPCGA